MLDSFYIAATGLKAGQESLSAISNNLSNVNTVSYKKSRVTFDDVFYRDMSGVAAVTFAGESSQTGMGTSVGETVKLFSPGDLKATRGTLDLAINGKGFLEVALPNGEMAYTRNGALAIGEDRYLVTREGYPLSGMIYVPDDVSSIAISEDGHVTGRVSGANEALDLGRIELATFVNDSALHALGNSLYLATEKTGQTAYVSPGEAGSGTLQQGFLESSNVDLVSEFIDMVVIQQMFSANSQVIKASDQIMQIINNLRQ